jgi:hypothetical protein
MAWNPSPEVQVARDAAEGLGRLAGGHVMQLVIVYITSDHRLGTVSYGRNSTLCSQAKLLGDKLHQRTVEHFEDYAG